MINLKCIICHKEFSVSPYYANRGQKCCSMECGKKYRKMPIPWNKGLKGIHLSEKSEWKKGERPQGSIVFNVGHIPWNKGKIKGKSAWFYKEKRLEYIALHKRISRKLKNISNCQWCGKSGLLHCANLSGKYLDDLSDWVKVCVKCHQNYDRIS